MELMQPAVEDISISPGTRALRWRHLDLHVLSTSLGLYTVPTRRRKPGAPLSLPVGVRQVSLSHGGQWRTLLYTQTQSHASSRTWRDLCSVPGSRPMGRQEHGQWLIHEWSCSWLSESHHVAKDGTRLWEKKVDMVHRDHGVGKGLL